MLNFGFSELLPTGSNSQTSKIETKDGAIRLIWCVRQTWWVLVLHRSWLPCSMGRVWKIHLVMTWPNSGVDDARELHRQRGQDFSVSRAISIYEGTGIAGGVDDAIDTEFCTIPGRKNVSEVAFVNVKTNKLVVNAVFNKKRSMIASIESGHQRQQNRWGETRRSG